MPWNSKDVRSRASGALAASEIKSPISKVPQKVQPVKEDIIVEKQKHEVKSKNNSLDMSNSSNVSSQVVSSSIIHSAEQSFGK